MELLEACAKLLDSHTPKKKRYTRSIEAPFSTEKMNREIMTKLNWEIMKMMICRSDENKNTYSNQHSD